MTERVLRPARPAATGQRAQYLADRHPDRRPPDGRAHRAGGRGRACPAADRRAGPEHLAARCGRALRTGQGRPRRNWAPRRCCGAYAKTRERDIALRARAIDLFNRVCQSGEPPIQALRSLGLKTVYDLAPLRRTVMRAGLDPDWRSKARSPKATSDESG